MVAGEAAAHLKGADLCWHSVETISDLERHASRLPRQLQQHPVCTGCITSPSNPNPRPPLAAAPPPAAAPLPAAVPAPPTAEPALDSPWKLPASLPPPCPLPLALSLPPRTAPATRFSQGAKRYSFPLSPLSPPSPNGALRALVEALPLHTLRHRLHLLASGTVHSAHTLTWRGRWAECRGGA